MKKLTEKQRGFTLIELVVVIAILGVLAAVSIPLITNYLGQAKERSYNAEGERIQAAVEAYYSAPDNTRFIGQRQYPLIGRGNTAQTLTNKTASVTYNDNGNTFGPCVAGVSEASATWNPVGGTQGADLTAKWTDDADGVRDPQACASADTWTSVSVTRGGTAYHTDPRYFLVDFEALVSAGLLSKTPKSAAPDNKPSGSTETYTGSYIWYVDQNGKVQSLNTHKPNQKGFVSGVFP